MSRPPRHGHAGKPAYRNQVDIVDSYSTVMRQTEKEDCLWRRNCLTIAVRTHQRTLPCEGCHKYVKESVEVTTGISCRSGWVY